MKKFKNNKNFIKKLEEVKQKDIGISTRRVVINNNEIFIIYIKQLTDRDLISSSIIKPLLQFKEDRLSIEEIVSSVIYIDDISIDDDEDGIINYVLNGKSVIIIPREKSYIIANTSKVEKRSVEAPDIQTSLKAPRDAFTENFQTNLSLIRYRLKDEALKIDNHIVGRRTKTSVSVLYMKDIANEGYVKEVKKRIDQIDVDGIMESGYVQKLIVDNVFNIFPHVGIAERSDTACANILKGKICVLVEGSNLALIMPQTFGDFLDSGDDHYDNIYLAVFTKFLRYLSITLSLVLSALYVAVVGFHSDILPPQFILAVATSRVTVPVNALVEATLMEGVSELLREASIRLPKQIGPAIGIVGTIVIGQAAVAAGLVSPLMVIIVSLSTMASFAAPDYTILNAIRIFKFFMIFITGVFGLFGLVMGYTLIIINLVSSTSFGVPYFSPMAPFNLNDFKNYILGDINLIKLRPKYLKTKDRTKH
ncbi:MAG: spore germination protein [Firmicutes bacterium]|nr:spore germination protein [Bacillota bacterium]